VNEPQPKKRRVVKKVSPKRRITAEAVTNAVDFSPESKDLARRREATVAPSVLEVVHPHYTLHLHIAWDVGYKSIYMEEWKLERALYHIVQQSSRFVVHRRDFKTYADRVTDQSYTICSIEFHDAAKDVPLAQLDQYGDARKLLEELAKGTG